MLTLNQIKAKLEEIQTNHSQLNSFYFGHPADSQDAGALRYNMMVVDLQDGSVSRKINTTNLRWAFCGKAPDGDDTIKVEVLSDMQLVALDCYAQFWEYLEANGIELSPNASFNPLEAVWDDSVYGWELQISINQFYSRDTCQVPTRA